MISDSVGSSVCAGVGLTVALAVARTVGAAVVSAGVAVLTGVGYFSGEEQAVREKASTSNRIARF